MNYDSRPTIVDDDRVLSFKQWCEINGFSRSTGQRLIANGHGPRLIKLSERRIGIRLSDHRAWQASRLIETLSA